MFHRLNSFLENLITSMSKICEVDFSLIYQYNAFILMAFEISSCGNGYWENLIL